jgi:hypothetical protein
LNTVFSETSADRGDLGDRDGVEPVLDEQPAGRSGDRVAGDALLTLAQALVRGSHGSVTTGQ